MKYFFVIALLGCTLSLHAQELPASPKDISPLLIGETVPDIYLVTDKGDSVSTHALFAGRKTILLFYRGGWCPFCNRHLSEVGQMESQLLALGYQIVAVSPDSPEALQKGRERNKELTYQLLSDSQGVFARAMGIAFQAPERYGKLLSDYSAGVNTTFLPVPALFLIDGNNEINFEFINPDYKKRISGELLLAVATALQNADE